MLKVYVYSKCSTCKKAIQFLNEHEIAFEQKEIHRDPPSPEELKRMLGYMKGEVRKLFNTSGILYREMQLSTRLHEMTVDEAVMLLSTHGMLVKRPFVLGDDFGLLGFKEAQWQILNQ